MADLKYYDVILKPVVTENSMAIIEQGKYTFLVHTESTKPQIREAVEKMFDGAKVQSVHTMNYGGKPKRRGVHKGRTAKFKKAIVKLAEGSKEIEIFQGM